LSFLTYEATVNIACFMMLTVTNLQIWLIIAMYIGLIGIENFVESDE